MFHILYGWMAGFILSFKVFLGQKLDKLSEKSNLYHRNIFCPPRLMKICTYILQNMLFKIPGLDSTKNLCVMLTLAKIWPKNG